MIRSVFCGLISVIVLASVPAIADEPDAMLVKSARTAQNSLYLELGGNAGLYSVNYERFVLDDLTARVGLMYMTLSATATSGTTTATANASWLAAPLMINYLGIGGPNHKFELGAGAVVMYFSAGVSMLSATAGANGVLLSPTATVGYRYAPTDGGFNFKAGFTPWLLSVAGKTTFMPWFGVSGGYGF